MTVFVLIMTAFFAVANFVLLGVAIRRRVRHGRRFAEVDAVKAKWLPVVEPWLRGETEQAPPAGETALDREAIERIITPVFDRSHGAQRERIMDYLKETGYVRYRERGLTDLRAWVRAKAANSLGLLGLPEHREALEQLLQDGAPEVRQAAVRALGRVGSPASFPALWKLAEKGHPDCREYLIGALRALGQEVVPPLLDAVNQNRNLETTLIALRVLRGFARADVVQALVHFVTKTEDRRLMVLALEALHDVGGADPELAQHVARQVLMKESEPAVLQAAIVLLSKWVNADNLKALGRALERPEWIVRRSAVTALHNIGPAAYDTLFRALEDPLSREVLLEEAQVSLFFQELIRNLEDPTYGQAAFQLLGGLYVALGRAPIEEALRDLLYLEPTLKRQVEELWAEGRV